MATDWRNIQDEREKYQAYLCSREWAVRKEAVHKRAEGVCERCGQYPIDSVHHLTYARRYDEPLEDLAGWCKHCHAYIHGKALWDPREDQSRIPVIDNVLSVHDALVDTFEYLDQRMERGGATGVPTGFADLDSLTGGLHESEVSVLASRPSVGKTAIALNIADYVSVKANLTVLFVSLEMSRRELSQRLLSSRGMIDSRKFRSGFLSGEDREKLVKAAEQLSKVPLYIDDSSVRTVAEIGASARRLRENAGLGLLVVDYLQLIRPVNSREPRQEQVASISRKLKALARELEIPVLCLAQLNRQVEAEKDNRPRLVHLRESGAIEQDADVVLLLHRPEQGMSCYDAQEQDLDGRAELIIAKQRNGPVGEVHLHWQREYGHFVSVSRDQDRGEFNQFDGRKQAEEGF